MDKFFLLIGILFCITSLTQAQYIIKKKLPPNNKYDLDSLKNKSDFLPKLHFNSLDSLKKNSLSIQNKIDYNMPMVKPDPNIKYNMPMVVPNPNVRYYMPMYRGPNGPEEKADSTDSQIRIKKDKEKKTSPKSQNKK